MDTPLLSVCLITYNHVNYIRQAIESVLMQKINFSWEFIIADDYSTDGTREIVLEYKEKYPELIKLILQKKNVGAAKNWIELMNLPRSKYVAYFDGDDYWTDPYKLQKQVDFLESNQEFVSHTHNAVIVDEDNNFIRNYNVLKDPYIPQPIELLKNLEIPTASVVFRNIGIKNFPAYFFKLPFDIILYYSLSKFGKFYMSPEIMSAYRSHGGGAWTGQSEIVKIDKQIEIQKFILDNLPLTPGEEKGIKNVIHHVRYYNLKIYANDRFLSKPYFNLLSSILKGIARGMKINFKFLLFCLIPDKAINYIKSFSKK